MECNASDSFLFHTEVVLHLSFSLFAKFNMHESNIFCKTSDFPQLQLDSWFGRVFFILLLLGGWFFKKVLMTNLEPKIYNRYYCFKKASNIRLLELILSSF